MNDRLEKIRELMSANKLDCYMVVDSDNHSSEYVNRYYKEMEYVSSFTGTDGLLVILKSKACLFTDGRYALQAKKELENTSIDYCIYPVSLTDAVKDYLKENNVNYIGLNGERFSTKIVNEIKEVSKVNASLDFVKEIWKDRKPFEYTPIFSVNDISKYSYIDKIEKVRNILGDNSLVLTGLSDIAWLFNLRGMDVKTSLFFMSFAYVSKEEVHLFLNRKSFNIKLNGVYVHEYSEFKDFLKTLRGKNILIDDTLTNYEYLEIIENQNNVSYGYTPVTLLKCIKDEKEIELTKDIHISDGLAVFRTMKYVNEHSGLDELKVRDKVLEFRMMDNRFINVSFETISGYNSNGAIIHYGPTKESNKEIINDGLLLLDSGGQYFGGTTDITRTFLVGSATSEMKKYYTLVLKAHIDISKYEFNENTYGVEIDLVSRNNFFDLGLDYKHGTGHGVGFMNNVHEEPNRFRYYGAKKDEYSIIKEGMITSNEPGIYLEGKFGVRIENEVLCIKKNDKLSFETITYCPYDLRLVDKSYLDDSEIKWLNDYHKMVYQKLINKVNTDEIDYLKEVTREI